MDYYNNLVSGWLGASHLVLALIALVTGAWVLLTEKGTSKHKKVGYVYVISMVLMNISAIPLTSLFGGIGPFHIFILMSLPTTLAALYFPLFARHRCDWLQYHFEFMCWSYLGLFAAFLAEIVVRIPIILAIETSLGLVVSVFALSGLTMWFGSVLIKRHRRKLSPA